MNLADTFSVGQQVVVTEGLTMLPALWGREGTVAEVQNDRVKVVWNTPYADSIDFPDYMTFYGLEALQGLMTRARFQPPKTQRNTPIIFGQAFDSPIGLLEAGTQAWAQGAFGGQTHVVVDSGPLMGQEFDVPSLLLDQVSQVRGRKVTRDSFDEVVIPSNWGQSVYKTISDGAVWQFHAKEGDRLLAHVHYPSGNVVEETLDRTTFNHLMDMGDLVYVGDKDALETIPPLEWANQRALSPEASLSTLLLAKGTNRMTNKNQQALLQQALRAIAQATTPEAAQAVARRFAKSVGTTRYESGIFSPNSEYVNAQDLVNALYLEFGETPFRDTNLKINDMDYLPELLAEGYLIEPQAGWLQVVGSMLD